MALLLALVMTISVMGFGTAFAAAETGSLVAGKNAPEGIDMTDPNNYFWQYDEPFEIHVSLQIQEVGENSLVDGDTADNNWWTRYYEDNYNIKFVVDWSASTVDYDQKLAMAIASDNLPDAFVCKTPYWIAASKAGLLRDISEDFQKYGSERLLTIYNDMGDKGYSTCSYDGEMTRLCNATITSEGVSCLMIRQDWLDKLGLEVPTTVAEVEEVAKAFKEAKLGGENTVAILGSGNDNKLYTTFDDSFNSCFGLDALFQAKGAYPGYFYKNENGEMVYGSLTPEFKDALEIAAKWYQEGILDPEIGTRTTGFEPVNNGTCGMFFGQWWTLGYGNGAAFLNDPEADWRSYPIYNDNNEWVIKVPSVIGPMSLCVSAEASDEVAHAVMLVNNIQNELEGFATELTPEAAEWMPLRICVGPTNEVDYGREFIFEVLDGKENAEKYKGDPVWDGAYQMAKNLDKMIQNYVSEEEMTRQNIICSETDAQWQALYAWIFGDAAYATHEATLEVEPALTYYTESMSMYWDNLRSLENRIVLSIIVGQEDISVFDGFVEQWYAEGGREVLNEVTAACA